MKTSNSINDHYIPKCLLDNFVDEKGKFFIYSNNRWSRGTPKNTFVDTRLQREIPIHPDFEHLPKKPTSLYSFASIPVFLNNNSPEVAGKTQLIVDADYEIFQRFDSDFGLFLSEAVSTGKKKNITYKSVLKMQLLMYMRTYLRIIENEHEGIGLDLRYILAINYFTDASKSFEEMYKQNIEKILNQFDNNIKYQYATSSTVDSFVLTDNPVMFTDLNGKPFEIITNEPNQINNFFHKLSEGFLCFLPITPNTLIITGCTKQFSYEKLLKIYTSEYLNRKFKKLISKTDQRNLISKKR